MFEVLALTISSSLFDMQKDKQEVDEDFYREVSTNILMNNQFYTFNSFVPCFMLLFEDSICPI